MAGSGQSGERKRKSKINFTDVSAFKGGEGGQTHLSLVYLDSNLFLRCAAIDEIAHLYHDGNRQGFITNSLQTVAEAVALAVLPSLASRSAAFTYKSSLSSLSDLFASDF